MKLREKLAFDIKCLESKVDMLESTPHEEYGDLKYDPTMQDPDVFQMEYEKRIEGLGEKIEKAEIAIENVKAKLTFVNALEYASSKKKV